MRRGGRVRGRSICARFFALCAAIAIASCAEYGVPIEIKYWDTGRSPLSHMVDVTNEFGLKVLAEHNFLNDNNIAFSPYGLMGIMVALYEGVDGDSSYQLQRAMQLPWNRNVMRIGFRDIHRTLKTYFVPEEGFLAGLALNNENVTFNENYKKALRFYGFDFETEETATASPNSTNASSTSATPAESSDSTLSTTVMTTLNIENIVTTKAQESTNPSVTNGGTEPITSPLSSTTIANEDVSAANGVETTTTLNNIIESTATAEVSDEPTVASSTVLDTSATSEPSSTAITTLNSDVEILADITSTTTEFTSEASLSTSTEASTLTTENIMTTTIAQDSERTSIMPTSSDMTSTLTTGFTTESATSTIDPITSTSENSIPSTDSLTSTTESTENNAESVSNSLTATINDSSLETLERRKKSIVDFIFTNPPYIDDYMLFRSLDVGHDLSNTGYGGDQFLVNGLKNIQVTYMNYDTVLEHAYLPHLEASALRLPLDSDRYYLLVVLPNRRRAGDLERLLTRMARESDLSDVYAALRPRRVRALVPSFVVKGHVTLTTDLQKLGIRDVFEPRQHDFTPMTCQGGVYVRSIEQAVSVAIRKYQPDDIKKNRFVTNRRRVYFSATYPFLYFVMDANIHVALMAGKMVDPLNTRIL